MINPFEAPTCSGHFEISWATVFISSTVFISCRRRWGQGGHGFADPDTTPGTATFADPLTPPPPGEFPKALS